MSKLESNWQKLAYWGRVGRLVSLSDRAANSCQFA